MEKPWKVILAFVGVFVAGAIFGGLLALRIARQISEQRPVAATLTPAVVPAARPPGGQPNQPMPQAVQTAQLMRRVTNQIGLTKGQRERVTPIIERAVQDFWHHQQNYNRENGFLLQRLKQDIGKELTLEQQTKLDDLWLKQLETFRNRQTEAREQIRGQGPAASAATPTVPIPNGNAASDQKPAPAEAAAPPTPAAKPPGPN